MTSLELYIQFVFRLSKSHAFLFQNTNQGTQNVNSQKSHLGQYPSIYQSLFAVTSMQHFVRAWSFFIWTVLGKDSYNRFMALFLECILTKTILGNATWTFSRKKGDLFVIGKSSHFWGRPVHLLWSNRNCTTLCISTQLFLKYNTKEVCTDFWIRHSHVAGGKLIDVGEAGKGILIQVISLVTQWSILKIY